MSDLRETPDFLANLKRENAAQPAEVAKPPLLDYYFEGERPTVRISWLVSDFFPMRSVNLIVGESQAGKTFVALDLAVAVASGRPFFGKGVTQGGVLYVASEGAITIPGRLKAARQGLPAGKRIAVIDDPPADLMDEGSVDRIIETAQHINEQMLEETGYPLVLVIIDTMVSSFGINNWNEVGETSKAMKVLNRIKIATGAAVAGVHHHGKDTSRGAAGSYALTASADSIISVYKKGDDGRVNRRYISLTKSRFGETGRTYDFELQTKPPDERDGEGDDQAFVVHSTGQVSGTNCSSRNKPLTRQGDHVLQSAFEGLLADHGVHVDHADHGSIKQIPLDLVKSRFEGMYQPKSGADPAEAKRKAWGRALDRLGEGLIKHGNWDGRECLFVRDSS